ncbi:MAG: aconitate hydratase [Candidatus Krumholzibacteriia bacterium]
MGRTVTRKIIDEHLVEGSPEPGAEIALRIDQTLTQDATGTLVMLAFEAMGVPRVRTEVSAQYVDHNLLQTDFRNADDHRYLRSACQRYGIWFSRPGNGVSHPVHMEHFGRPGRTLLGSDSHTPAAGAVGMLALGAGGLDVALAMAGHPYRLRMPEVWGVELTGTLPPWVSAKDVILEMLRRHGVDGALGRVIEYHGPGLAGLSAMDRHVIANMGTELGATSTVFPADAAVRTFLRSQDRGHAFVPLAADPDARHDRHETIDLSALEPLIALPGSPGNVVPVREVAGRRVHQAYIGSSANPGLRDFAVPALMVAGRQVAAGVSFDVNPTSRRILASLMDLDLLPKLVRAGARIHQAGCNGCIGMGQAPATDTISLRTVPRNFPGRSGSRDDQVYLCSPETATAAALTGRITDPRDLDQPYPEFREPEHLTGDDGALEAPPPPDTPVALVKGPNIVPLPDLEPLPDSLALPVLLNLGDGVSTDEIMPAGARVLPLRSNIPRIADFVFDQVEEGFAARARRHGDFCIVAGRNYGQGSSREHAALAPRYLGLRAVIAEGFARIHRRNLVNYGILPLELVDPGDRALLVAGAELELPHLHDALAAGEVAVRVKGRAAAVRCRLVLSPGERAALAAGGRINVVRAQEGQAQGQPGPGAGPAP